jgi:hypothetical protein
MSAQPPTVEVCKEIVGELQDILGWFSGSGLPPEQFRQSVVMFEAAKMQRFGLQLASRVSLGGKVHFSLRAAESEELIASMDVDPRTGVLEAQNIC